jgi:hypothetical protein
VTTVTVKSGRKTASNGLDSGVEEAGTFDAVQSEKARAEIFTL